jgi:hypothetical protein
LHHGRLHVGPVRNIVSGGGLVLGTRVAEPAARLDVKDPHDRDDAAAARIELTSVHDSRVAGGAINDPCAERRIGDDAGARA